MPTGSYERTEEWRKNQSEFKKQWWEENKSSHCINGHEYTPENTRLSPEGERSCRVCARDHDDRYKARAKQWVLDQVQKQGGCALCDTTEVVYGGKSWSKNWHRDHDHSIGCHPGVMWGYCSGCFRSILCAKCNLLVGMIEKNAELIPKILEYLAKHKARLDQMKE